MWEQLQDLLASKSPWSGVVFLVVGAILGAVVSAYFSVRSQRPRLIIGGSGSGGNQQSQRWSISIMNRPTFFGVRFAGETARDLQPWITLKDRPQSHYPLFWSGQQPSYHASIEAGQSQSIELFSWFSDKRGSYFVLDHSGEPAAKFDAPELDFVLRLNDRLGRMTEFNFKVKFDDSHLKNPPQLQVLLPISLENRVQMFRKGVRQVLRAFYFRV